MTALHDILSRPITEDEKGVIESIDKIPGLFNRADILILYRLSAATPSDALMMEIGSYLGRSTSAIGYAIRGSKRRLVCIDTWDMYCETAPDGYRAFGPFGLLCAFYDNIRPFIEQIVVLRGEDTHYTTFLPFGQFGLVFIDGNHLYPHVKMNIDMAYNLLAPNGIICGHDYTPQAPELAGLVRAVDETVLHSPRTTEAGMMIPGSSMWFARFSG